MNPLGQMFKNPINAIKFLGSSAVGNDYIKIMLKIPLFQ